ncbi:MAG TPA: transcription termination/antitermination factor NusG [Planctomycetaceae bacterium]|nr:transcription termination/antitermination factor NusG [Planctomycetaceae bacterium]
MRAEETEGQPEVAGDSPATEDAAVTSSADAASTETVPGVAVSESSTESTADQGAAAAGATATDKTTSAEATPAEPASEADDDDDGWDDDDQLDESVHVEPIEEISEEEETDEEAPASQWYILKVQVNRETSIADALRRAVKMNGMEEFFDEVIVPTEDVVEFTKSGKRRTVKKKLYPGYIMVNMILNDDTWFLVRDTSGIGDFTGSAGKPTPMNPDEVNRIIKPESEEGEEEESAEARIAIPFNPGDRVRVKEGYFQNFEGEVESIDDTNGRVTVIINIFGRSTPVELQHWQMESL